MSAARPLNAIVAGVGGQGVLTLTRVLWRLAEEAGMGFQGASFKGGAQTLGSVHSVLRLFPAGERRGALYSTQVIEGDLDLLVGLDPWEALRHAGAYGPSTRIFVNARARPLLVERYRASALRDPLAALRALGLSTAVRDYDADAIQMFGSARMANFLIGHELTTARALPFDPSHFVAAFAASVALDPATAARVRASLHGAGLHGAHILIHGERVGEGQEA